MVSGYPAMYLVTLTAAFFPCQKPHGFQPCAMCCQDLPGFVVGPDEILAFVKAPIGLAGGTHAALYI